MGEGWVGWGGGGGMGGAGRLNNLDVLAETALSDEHLHLPHLNQSLCLGTAV